jgi:uncharacterized membrane protein YagU involved in acid resistance
MFRTTHDHFSILTSTLISTLILVRFLCFFDRLYYAVGVHVTSWFWPKTETSQKSNFQTLVYVEVAGHPVLLPTCTMDPPTTAVRFNAHISRVLCLLPFSMKTEHISGMVGYLLSHWLPWLVSVGYFYRLHDWSMGRWTSCPWLALTSCTD